MRVQYQDESVISRQAYHVRKVEAYNRRRIERIRHVLVEGERFRDRSMKARPGVLQLPASLGANGKSFNPPVIISHTAVAFSKSLNCVVAKSSIPMSFLVISEQFDILRYIPALIESRTLSTSNA